MLMEGDQLLDNRGQDVFVDQVHACAPEGVGTPEPVGAALVLCPVLAGEVRVLGEQLQEAEPLGGGGDERPPVDVQGYKHVVFDDQCVSRMRGRVVACLVDRHQMGSCASNFCYKSRPCT
eukprot:CAMPEP_0174961246 /NCGR_PEP_ID=MMETSP0004_2-20121128/4136_1 /TAXON_ID=420556 /ORGANISM="Ochromonas sp., Strain CCMP1393" /LENGTH=119 /DNA_ID=CAMNT_0016209675 /DNA_START=527 /DNA_END=889 /DNA_ORIENTATION=-